MIIVQSGIVFKCTVMYTTMAYNRISIFFAGMRKRKDTINVSVVQNEEESVQQYVTVRCHNYCAFLHCVKVYRIVK